MKAGGFELLSRKALTDKIKESLTSVLPIGLIVLILALTFTPIPADSMLTFLAGIVLVIVGMGLFTLGADSAMTPMGERVGTYLTKSKKLPLIIAVSFLLGVIVTVSEPDLQVLASQVPTIPTTAMILSVGLGVGLFLVIALLRILFAVPLKYLLIGSYIVCFALSFFVPSDFWAVAFDAGGVTTGPMTVPLIMALGTGVSSIRSDKGAQNDSFGLVALSSVGPILTVLILGLIYGASDAAYVPAAVPSIDTTGDLSRLFLDAFPTYLGEVARALGSVILFFIIFDVFFLKLKKEQLVPILFGFVETFVGLVLFLTGANVGFMPVGNYLGSIVASLPLNWVLIPLGALLGYFVVSAEPAVHVLNHQVQGVTGGSIPSWALSVTLSIGVAAAIAFSMLRVLTGLSILWILIPGYALALALTFFSPSIFTSIAFDAGGVASGPMTATFLLTFAMGACTAVGGNVVTDAFGLVALVAMVPLIAIQVLGLVHRSKTKDAGEDVFGKAFFAEDTIIEFM
jgi:hypothetical protein